MEHAGVPISIVSKWAGHYDSAFTQKTYVNSQELHQAGEKPQVSRSQRCRNSVSRLRTAAV